jgi:hypothetical protein
MKTLKRWSAIGSALFVFGLFTAVNSPSAVNSRLWWLGFAWQGGAGILIGYSIGVVAKKLERANGLRDSLVDRGYAVPIGVLLDAPNWRWIEEKIQVFEEDPQAFGSLVDLLKNSATLKS